MADPSGEGMCGRRGFETGKINVVYSVRCRPGIQETSISNINEEDYAI